MADPSWLIGRKIVALVSYSPILHVAELDNGGAIDVIESQVMTKEQYDAAKDILNITCPYPRRLTEEKKS